MIRIAQIESPSAAQQAGLLAGDRILKINDEEIRDRLDFEFYKSEEFLELEIMRGDRMLHLEIEREGELPLGIEPEVMKIHVCRNNCVFCFVHQMPRGMRRSLYVKDEDFRYSFLDGHFTTLSNMKQADWDRVVEQRLSPIYISVHSTDTELRNKMLKNPRLEPIVDRMAWLRENAIDFHTQLVVVPGWNDGEHLERSLRELCGFFPAMRSISIVPVGLTAYRAGLPDLRTLDRDDAIACLDAAARWGQRMAAEHGKNFIFPSDEMYVLADREFPPASFYGAFEQYENGVGTLRALIDDFAKELPKLPRAPADWEVTVLTAPLAARTQEGLLKRFESERGLKSELLVCENQTFGAVVTCTGLLCGRDLLAAAKTSKAKGPVLIPPNCLNQDGLFLDDQKPSDLERELGRRVLAPQFFREYLPNAC